MGELQEIIETMEKWQANGEKLALATVISIKGSAYRRPGARMLISENGNAVGMIGGGCFDQDVKEIALDVIQTKKPRLKLYNLSDLNVWGLGLGCNGSVYVLIESLEVSLGKELILNIKQSLTKNESLVIHHNFSKPLDFLEEIDLEVEVKRFFNVDSFQPLHENNLFTERIDPAPRLVIFGAGHDVIPVVNYAKQSGFNVVVVDQRSDLLNNKRFPGASLFIHSQPENYHEAIEPQKNDYVLFMSHQIHKDAEAFNFYRKQQVRYLGFLGPKKRTKQIVHDILGLDNSEIKEVSKLIYSPVGLDIGAETAEQVALSIVSELMIIKNNTTPRFLKDKSGTIHGPDDALEHRDEVKNVTRH